MRKIIETLNLTKVGRTRQGKFRLMRLLYYYFS